MENLFAHTRDKDQVDLLAKKVADNGGKASGAFDVMAWRGSQFVFLEYKGPGDRPNRNQPRWIDAALRAGVSEADLLLISGVER